MRTITLELLRHGPAHNQLLSPLTPYLALCENHAAVTLHVPFEHNQFLHRLSALGYKFGEELRTFQLQDTARVLGEILGGIPGLTAESNKAADDGEYLTHLRLIISASELALLPFELALSPGGLPGSGQHLLLQPQMPMCLTREIRRVPGEQLQWPRKPRILFVAAAPPVPEIGSIPLESHLLALRRVIAPWVKYFDEKDARMQRQRIEEHLVFLPGASIEAIEQACASNEFTHVHILAHGVERKVNYDTRFFLALHKASNPSEVEYISGTRLATALRPLQRPDNEGLARPVVVTLASCNSGDVGSVAGAGASIAHALHESGIPMVVASQFPLSFEGSVRLVECLYEGLLWGIDPRRLLYDLRRRLYAHFQDKHDWASLTAYVSLPSDFTSQLATVQIGQAMRSIEAAMNHADEATRQFLYQLDEVPPATDLPAPATGQPARADREQEEAKKLLDDAREKIRKAKQKLEKLLTRLPAEKVRILGLVASTEKREAEVIYSTVKAGSTDRNVPKQDLEEAVKLLRRSQGHYWDTFMLNRANSWAAVQYLSLALIVPYNQEETSSLQQGQAIYFSGADESRKRELHALWSLAQQLSLQDLNDTNRQQVIWAHGNLIELYLLTLIMPGNNPALDPQANLDAPARKAYNALPNEQEAGQLALKHTAALVAMAGRDSFAVYSTRRQVLRYKGWFSQIANVNRVPAVKVDPAATTVSVVNMEPLKALAHLIAECFPDEVENGLSYRGAENTDF
jgi:hypothetical protein